jgi:hypothetical protein
VRAWTCAASPSLRVERGISSSFIYRAFYRIAGFGRPHPEALVNGHESTRKVYAGLSAGQDLFTFQAGRLQGSHQECRRQERTRSIHQAAV